MHRPILIHDDGFVTECQRAWIRDFAVIKLTGEQVRPALVHDKLRQIVWGRWQIVESNNPRRNFKLD